MTKVNYEPWRLVSNGKGRNAGNEFAPVDFKMAEAARAQNGKDSAGPHNSPPRRSSSALGRGRARQGPA